MFLKNIIHWSNGNAGFQGLLLFFTTIFLGWVSGIVRSLRTKPKFNIELAPGPNFCSTFEVGEKFNDYEVHQTGISLYLKVSNIGSAPASIKNIELGFHWQIGIINFPLWIRYRLGWDWIDYPTIALVDFGYDLGEKGGIKIYPFLIQSSRISGGKPDTYLSVGKNTNGVIYFELDKSYGARFPAHLMINGKKYTQLKIKIEDSFDITHQQTFRVPLVELSEARKYCPSFGATLSTYREENYEQSPIVDNSLYNNEEEKKLHIENNSLNDGDLIENMLSLIQLEKSKISAYASILKSLKNFDEKLNDNWQQDIEQILYKVQNLGVQIEALSRSYTDLNNSKIDEITKQVNIQKISEEP